MILLTFIIQTELDICGEFGNHSHSITLLNTYTSYIIRLLVKSTCSVQILYTIHGIDYSAADDCMCYWYQVMIETKKGILDHIFEQHPQDCYGTEVIGIML